MAYIIKSDYTAFTTTVISDADFALISEARSDINAKSASLITVVVNAV